MNVNAHLDARMNDKPGYFVLKRTGVKMDEFFEWYENAIIYPNCRLVRQSYSRVEIVDEEVDFSLATRVWVDSDMGHINRILDLTVMERNLRRGIVYGKIGAKYTNVGQPQDLLSAFKVQRAISRTITAQGAETPLKMTLECGLAGLEREGRLDIPDRKKRAMIDIGATAPEVKGKAYTDKKTKEGWVAGGFADKATKTCPDLDGLIEAADVNFDKFPGGRVAFIASIPVCLAEMKRNGLVSEQHYDELGFPVDEDSQGNLWHLTAKSIVFAWSMPLYSDFQLRMKREENLMILHNMQAAQQSKL